MIELTRLNNRPLIVNSDLVKFIENTPDTVLTLTTGEKVVVSESRDVVMEKIIEYRRKIFAGVQCAAGAPDRPMEEANTPPADESVED